MLPLLGGAAYVLTHNVPPNAAPSTPAAIEAVALAIPSAPKLIGDEIALIVQRNDTLERIFRRLRLSLDDLATILQVPGVRESLQRLRPGDKVTVVHEDGVVHALNRRINDTQVLSVMRGGDGFAAEVITTPLETSTARAHGKISTSLFVAARAAGVTPETILRLANDIFGWEIDFALDIQPGDRFKLVYEKKYRDGQYISDGRILAAEFINNGMVHRAVRYTSADGVIDDYFSPDGRSMRRQFLRAPLDFTRISSGFSFSRLNPILNTFTAHRGVDYAAPTGTPIKAAGDGRVSFAGVNGGYGRVVMIEHGGRVTTLYAHMSRFASDVYKGQRIKQGQIIGYVGSSGWSTGPHLHYEYRVDGTHMNPRTVKLPSATPVPAEYRTDFLAKSAALLAELERPDDSTVAALPRN
jgi:murein DD-endopeptidase MepM/ murein hydrolase activator NlpD